jgi:hypothetical protein
MVEVGEALEALTTTHEHIRAHKDAETQKVCHRVISSIMVHNQYAG